MDKAKICGPRDGGKMPPMSPKCTTRNPKQKNNNLASCLSPLTHWENNREKERQCFECRRTQPQQKHSSHSHWCNVSQVRGRCGERDRLNCYGLLLLLRLLCCCWYCCCCCCRLIIIAACGGSAQWRSIWMRLRHRRRAFFLFITSRYVHTYYVVVIVFF